MCSFKNLTEYKKSYELALIIFKMSKAFPKEEIYSLTDQVRRSSRSVCANIAEGYRKRIYPKNFTLKMTDANGEASETIVWLDFALDCNYISKESYDDILSGYQEVGKMIGSMVNNPEKFIPKDKHSGN